MLGERGRQHVDLLVDHRLGFRTFEGDLDAVRLRRLLGAGFTACQNWCWKPLEMSGM